jgi:tRNA nucleotidyltransferase/poly(A) polymerase
MSPQHEISLSLKPPVEGLIRGLARCLALKGVTAYLVGGSLRDAMLGRPIRDVDLAIEGDSLPRAVGQELGASSRTRVGRGIARLVSRRKASPLLVLP